MGQTRHCQGPKQKVHRDRITHMHISTTARRNPTSKRGHGSEISVAISPDVLEVFFYDNASPGALAGYELDDVSLDRLVAGETSTSVVPKPGSSVPLTMFFCVAGQVCAFERKSARARISERATK
jgi:hypothetical protein